MKITYIFPPLGFRGQKVASMPLAPPVLEYMAGLTARLRPEWEIQLINANKEDIEEDRLSNTDVVGISVLTHQANWAYRLADNLKSKGIKVLLGGPHPSVLPDEAKQHCDSVIIGEAESVLGEILSDVENNTLKKIYTGEALPLVNLSTPKRDLLKGYVFHSYFTSRGCPYSCTFCTTPILHGKKVRYRPIDDVIKDIANSKHKRWFCSDPDIWGPDVKRYTELFKEMSRSLPGIMWIGEASLSAVQRDGGDKMLYWARKSGLSQVLVGLESFNDNCIEKYSANHKLSTKENVRVINQIRDSGIDVILFLMIDPINCQADDYGMILEKCNELKIAAHPVMTVPYPMTKLFHDNKISKTWDFFDGLHDVFNTEVDKQKENEKKLMNLWAELYTAPRIIRRITKISCKGFPNAHISSLAFQLPLRRAFSEYGKAYIRDFEDFEK